MLDILSENLTERTVLNLQGCTLDMVLYYPDREIPVLALLEDGNAVLITAQKADATQLSDFKGWKNNGVFIKKGESGIVLLEPGEEYTKEDGTVGVSYNSKKVFDISQTTAKAKDRPAMKRDERLLLKAIIHNAPAPSRSAKSCRRTSTRISSRRQENLC